MPLLPRFSDNAFKSRDDCISATFALLGALRPYTSTAGARIKLSTGTAAHFDEVAAQLEGFARPLWGVGALLASEAGYDDHGVILDDLRSYITGLAAGVDDSLPGGPGGEFWGNIKNMDQRMVEMEIVSFALLSAPDAFLPLPAPDDSIEKAISQREIRQRVIKYLNGINNKEMPPTNWLWFRVMTNLALVKVGAFSYAEKKASMDADLDMLNTYYVGEGWSSDGKWSDQGRQADYYSGSFAIQFSQLLYVKHAATLDPVRCAIYKERAKQFASAFVHYFDDEGAAIPFGRSLTYRFAMGGFWSAVALAEVPLPEDLFLGHVKGLLLRHLRWWAAHPDIFHPDGTLNIGFSYPNMYVSEDYNSPQSPYWCLKILIAIALPADHEFWQCEELPHPLSLACGTADAGEMAPMAKLLEKPCQILVRSPKHHFLLNSGQFCPWPIKASEAKYCKFAYSSAFGFSVPTGTLIQQLVPDNALAISEDAGETWKVRWQSEAAKFGTAEVYSEGIRTEILPTLIDSWAPSKASKVGVCTTLVPPNALWPDWHVRIHRVSFVSRTSTEEEISFVEGGFAIYGQQKTSGLAVPSCSPFDVSKSSQGELEGTVVNGSSAIIFSSSGASGIVQQSSCSSKGVILKPDSNTNLVSPRTLLPTIQQSHKFGQANKTYTFVVAVFGISTKGITVNSKQVLEKWNDRPVVVLGGQEHPIHGPFIVVR